jgi:hypothetical protein
LFPHRVYSVRLRQPAQLTAGMAIVIACLQARVRGQWRGGPIDKYFSMACLFLRVRAGEPAGELCAPTIHRLGND